MLPSHAGKDSRGGGKIRRAEEHPPDDDRHEGDDGSQYASARQRPDLDVLAQRSPSVVDQQIDAVQATPDYECPRGAMPQAADQHGRHDVDIAAADRPAIATQRNVNVVTQKTRQGDVPAAPEIDHAAGLVW